MRYRKDALMEYCVAALRSVEVPQEDAAQIAQVLTSADERGVHSHGVVRMQGYVSCLQSGGIKAESERKIVTDGASFALLDAGQGLGIPISVYAAQLAAQKAEENGIAIVNVRNSHHHGACGYYAMQIARGGKIGIAMSTGDVIMAAAGTAENSIGNNPFSYAVQAGKYGMICYDIAMSSVAMGKIAMAAEEGRAIPLGWMIDKEGQPTTNPNAYMDGGVLLPFGGYKGAGLAMMVEELAGVLSGAALLKDIHAWNTDPAHGGNVGHCFIAIDPRRIVPGLDIQAQNEKMIEQIRARKKAPGVQRIYFPGEIEQECETRAKQEGIALPVASEHALRRVSQLTGIVFRPEMLQVECREYELENG